MFIPKILLSTSCLPVLDTAKARMFYIWHFCHMVFKYEKGKLYFTNNFDQNTIYMALACLVLSRTICELLLASNQKSLCKL